MAVTYVHIREYTLKSTMADGISPENSGTRTRVISIRNDFREAGRKIGFAKPSERQKKQRLLGRLRGILAKRGTIASIDGSMRTMITETGRLPSGYYRSRLPVGRRNRLAERRIPRHSRAFASFARRSRPAPLLLLAGISSPARRACSLFRLLRPLPAARIFSHA